MIPADHRTRRHKRRVLLVQLVTLFRIPLAVTFLIVLSVLPLSNTAVWVCLLLLVANELSDLLDGVLARRLDAVTEWGAMLDPYADSMSRLIIYFALAVNELALLVLPLLMALRDITVAYARIIMSWHGQSVSAKRSGKIKAWFLGVGAFLLLLGPFYWELMGDWTIRVISWILILVTIASAVEYVASAFSLATASMTKKQP